MPEPAAPRPAAGPDGTPDPIRVALSELKVNPGGYLEAARGRRVLLTRRGRVVGELVPLAEPKAAPLRPLCGALRDRLSLAPDADLTAPVEARWEALG